MSASSTMKHSKLRARASQKREKSREDICNVEPLSGEEQRKLFDALKNLGDNSVELVEVFNPRWTVVEGQEVQPC